MLNKKTSLREILDGFPLGPKSSELEYRRPGSSKQRSHESIRTWRKPGGSMGIRAHHRIPYAADVIISTEGIEVVGQAATLSLGGVFVKTEATVFEIGQTVMLLIIPPRGEKTYFAKAKVCNMTSWPRGREGYGFEFVRPEPASTSAPSEKSSSEVAVEHEYEYLSLNSKDEPMAS